MITMTIKNPKQTFKRVGVILLFLLLSFYVYRQASRLIEGPLITITEPQNGAVVLSKSVSLKGLAKNVVFISLNDQPIFIEESGQFSEQLLLGAGYNIMSLKGRDKFGNTTETFLELILAHEETPEEYMPAGGSATTTSTTTNLTN